MKVLLINGSPKQDGCTKRALNEMKKIFLQEGIEVQEFDIGTNQIRGCVDCKTCYKTGKCVFDDVVNKAAKLFEEADGIVIGSPVYYSSPNGSLISFLDRLFYSTHFSKRFKVGASVTSCRRAGNTANYDIINKYFGISEMPIASSTYWNMVFGKSKEEVEHDKEGLQTMRVLARNMVFLMKAIKLLKDKEGLPESEESIRTNFIK